MSSLYWYELYMLLEDEASFIGCPANSIPGLTICPVLKLIKYETGVLSSVVSVSASAAVLKSPSVPLPQERQPASQQRRDEEACKNEILMLSLLVAGFTRSSVHFSLLENCQTAAVIETEEIFHHVLTQIKPGSHESLLCDLGAHCYLGGGGWEVGSFLPSFMCLWLGCHTPAGGVLWSGFVCKSGCCASLDVLWKSPASRWRTDTIDRSNQCSMDTGGKSVSVDPPILLASFPLHITHTHTYSNIYRHSTPHNQWRLGDDHGSWIMHLRSDIIAYASTTAPLPAPSMSISTSGWACGHHSAFSPTVCFVFYEELRF